MLVQIKDYNYLQTQKQVSPNVVAEMFQYCGDTFEIDTDYIDDNKIYYYKGFS